MGIEIEIYAAYNNTVSTVWASERSDETVSARLKVMLIVC